MGALTLAGRTNMTGQSHQPAGGRGGRARRRARSNVLHGHHAGIATGALGACQPLVRSRARRVEVARVSFLHVLPYICHTQILPGTCQRAWHLTFDPLFAACQVAAGATTARRPSLPTIAALASISRVCWYAQMLVRASRAAAVDHVIAGAAARAGHAPAPRSTQVR